MEKTPSFESRESKNEITPETVLAEIRSRFSSSRELYNHVKEMVDKNYAMKIGGPRNTQEAADAVLHRLASVRRGGVMEFDSKIGMGNREDITSEEAERTFKSGALLGLLTASIYYGEATFISKDGKVLSEPVEM